MNARRSTLAVLTAALALLACGRDEGEQAAPPPDPAPAARAPGPPPLSVSPAGGAPGTEVRLAMSGLVLHAKVEVGFGSLVGHEILAAGEADVDGGYTAVVTIPPAAPPGISWFFLAEQETTARISAPTPFLVTAANGSVRVTGHMTGEGVECPAMRGEAGELYTLAAVDELPEAGTKVMVEGTLAEMSPCQQGLTIAVTSLRALR